MRRTALLLLGLLVPSAAAALSAEARAYIAVLRELEDAHCEKRKLRRAIAIAAAEGRSEEAQRLRARFAAIGREPRVARLEARLAQLERRISDGRGGTRDPEDLEAISAEQRRLFYRCE